MECFGLYSYESCKNVPLKSVNISCDIFSFCCDVSVKFTYVNDTDEAIEPVFMFPLNNVAVYYFEARIGDKIIVAECRPREEAKITYDGAVSEGHTAFIVEQNEQCDDLFKMSVGNIPSKSTIDIVLKYSGLLEVENLKLLEKNIIYSQITFTLPTVINPRYMPEESKIPNESNIFNLPATINSIPYLMTFEANLNMPYEILEVDSVHDRFNLSHTSLVKTSGLVVLTSEFKPDHDFQMIIKLKQPVQSLATIEAGDSKKSGVLSKDCIMVQFLPDFSEVNVRQETRNEIVFLIDRSGSMEGENIAYTKSSLLLFLKSLPTTCRFQIIGFGSTHESLFPEAVDYTEESLNRALDYQRNLDADMGGTEIYPALEAALKAPLTGKGWCRHIIILTDGDIYQTDDVYGLIRKHNNSARVFAIGLGEGASTTLVSGLARLGRGMAAFVRHHSQLNRAVMKILDATLQPRATNVKVEWKIEEKLASGDQTKSVAVNHVPQEIPPIFSGQYVTCFGFFSTDDLSNLQGQVVLTYEFMNDAKLIMLDLSHLSSQKLMVSYKSLPIHHLAGKVQIQELLDKYNGLMLIDSTSKPETEFLRKQIEDLSCHLNLLTKFTSLVGVDPNKVCVQKCSYDVEISDCVQKCSYDVEISDCVQKCSLQDCADVECVRYCSVQDCADVECVHDYADVECDDVEISDCVQKCSLQDCADVECESEQSQNENIDVKPQIFVEKHIMFAELQNFRGSWDLNSDLADVLNVNLEKFMSYQLSNKTNINLTSSIWGTTLVIAYLELNLSSHKEEWFLMIEKAKRWLHSELSKQIKDTDEAYVQLINQAKAVLRDQ